MGKPLPLALLGYNTPLELALKLEEVVEVVTLEDGQQVLHGVPDDKTKGWASDVRNQMTNFEGYNFRTGQVLCRVGHADRQKVTKSPPGTVEVSDYMKRKLRQLVANHNFSQEGLSFHQFEEAFEGEVGHPLDLNVLSFVGLEDFISLGVPDILELQLGWDGRWRIVPAGTPLPQSAAENHLIEELRDELRHILERSPHGISVKKLIQGSQHSNKLVEVAMMSPDICLVDKFGSELTFLPASFSYGRSRALFPLHQLGELKTEIHNLIKPLKERVSLDSLKRGLQGLDGSLTDPAQFGCETFLDVVLLMPDVCRVTRAQDSTLMVQPSRGEVTETDDEVSPLVVKSEKFSAEFLLKVRRVLAEYPGGVKDVELQFRRINGEPLSCPGYDSLNTLLGDLNGRHGFVWDGRRLSSSCDVRMLPVVKEDDLPSGWMEVIEAAGPSALVVPKRLSPEIWALEVEMERFYLEPSSCRQRLTGRECVVGQTVAAVNRNSALRRARILQSFSILGLVKVLYVDHGTKALLSQSSLFKLEPQFCGVAEQVATVVRLEGMEPGTVFYHSGKGEKKKAGQSKRIKVIEEEVLKFIFGLIEEKKMRNQ